MISAARLSTILAFLLIAGAVVPASAHAAPSKKGRCGLDRATVVRGGVQAVVLKTAKGDLYGCWRKTQRRTRLLRMPRGPRFDYVVEATYLTLQGRFVGYEIVAGSSRDVYRYTLRIVDLKTGQNKHSVLPFNPEAFPEPGRRLGSVRQLLIARDGDATWLARNLGMAASRPLQVYKVDRQRSLLDAGPGVEARSLALTRTGTIYWTNSGQARSAQMD
jgi:hypothetical protein